MEFLPERGGGVIGAILTVAVVAVDLPGFRAFRQLKEHLLKRPGGDREMMEILAFVLQHDEQAVLCAVEL